MLLDALRIQFGDSACWNWPGAVSSNGYAPFVRSDGTQTTVHRIVYELEHGAVRPGSHIDHLCRNRRCVNTSHLEEVTPQENTLRGEGPAAANAIKTHCGNGHPYTGTNARGSRVCRTCLNKASREYAERKRAKSAH